MEASCIKMLPRCGAQNLLPKLLVSSSLGNYSIFRLFSVLNVSRCCRELRVEPRKSNQTIQIILREMKGGSSFINKIFHSRSRSLPLSPLSLGHLVECLRPLEIWMRWVYIVEAGFIHCPESRIIGVEFEVFKFLAINIHDK